MATPMRPDTWDNIPRNIKLAYVMYPAQAPKWAQDEMRRRAAIEGKQAPRGLLNAPAPDYSKVPSLVRKRK